MDIQNDAFARNMKQRRKTRKIQMVLVMLPKIAAALS